VVAPWTSTVQQSASYSKIKPCRLPAQKYTHLEFVYRAARNETGLMSEEHGTLTHERLVMRSFITVHLILILPKVASEVQGFFGGLAEHTIVKEGEGEITIRKIPKLKFVPLNVNRRT